MKTKEFTLPKELLPDWGPYSKKYMGISKVTPDTAIPGARFDCVAVSYTHLTLPTIRLV